MEYTKGGWRVDEPGWFEELYVCNVWCGDELICRPDGENASVVIANAHLIASAPDLYEACKAQHNAIDILFAMLIGRDDKFFPSKSGKPWEAVIMGNKAIAKAEGR